ncbi:hypothetical protein BpHYR1_029641 [Brachionus plicatilis]|uniref:Uncharacterized protein n=1 Tax=Brachionus plicatilis TaxID=10195 RepID=A0A3M7Q600_BRAPC|nr:hypothetical protein BpHYR1_029641 [Brachionus plicatilis]
MLLKNRIILISTTINGYKGGRPLWRPDRRPKIWTGELAGQIIDGRSNVRPTFWRAAIWPVFWPPVYFRPFILAVQKLDRQVDRPNDRPPKSWPTVYFGGLRIRPPVWPPNRPSVLKLAVHLAGRQRFGRPTPRKRWEFSIWGKMKWGIFY